MDKATRLARTMVVSYGMSDLGPGYWGPQADVSEMGRTNWFEPAQLSNEMQAKVDKEIQKIIEAAYKLTEKTLKEKREKLDVIALKLLEVENLEGEEFEKLIGEPRPEYENQLKMKNDPFDKLRTGKLKIEGKGSKVGRKKKLVGAVPEEI